MLLLAAAHATRASAPLPGSLSTPPAGWRSWNQFGGGISQELMVSMMEGLADRSRLVDGVPTSLIDLGYNRIGMDDNWQVHLVPAVCSVSVSPCFVSRVTGRYNGCQQCVRSVSVSPCFVTCVPAVSP